MKIGKLDFKEYAAKKPVTITSAGKMMSAKEVLADRTFSFGSLHAFTASQQKQLALERYKMEPDFKLGIFNQGVMTKAEVIKNIEDETDFGKIAIQAEMQYCNELMDAVRANAIPAYPHAQIRPITDIEPIKVLRRCVWLKLKTTALFAENTTDSVTSPFAAYRIAQVHPVFAARGFNVVVNSGVNDTRTNFVTTAKKSLTVYLSGIGHGNYTLYTGHAGCHILEVGAYDPAEVKDKAIHFLSCRTAAQLGPDTVTRGAKCYAGYNENFTFVWDDPSTPINEVDLFKRCDSTFDIWMANGHTAQQSFNAAIATFNASIALVPGTTAASWLTYDRDHFKLHGNTATAILPYRYVKICLPLATPLLEEKLAEAGELVE